MIKFLELHIRNFYSYGNNITVIPLSFTEPTLIIGENHDVMINGEFDTNAVGKSSILNALSYVLYGKPISPVKKIDDVINNINKKNTYVAVIFEINGLFYKIERWRKNAKMGGVGNNGVKITKADTFEGLTTSKIVETPAGREAEARIAEDILNMPFDIFARIAAITAKYPPPFLSLPATHTKDASQTSILEELFGQKELTEKARILKDRIKETIAEITRLTELNDRIGEEVGRYTQQLELAKNSIDSWNVSHASDIENIKTTIAGLESIDYEAELAHLSRIKEVDDAMHKLSTKLTLSQSKLDDHNNTQKRYEQWAADNAAEQKSLTQLLAPYASIDFDNELKNLKIVERLKSEHTTEITLQSTLKSTLKELYTKIDTLNSEVKILKSSKCPYCSQAYYENKNKIIEKENDLKIHALEYNETQVNLDSSKSRTETILASIDEVECMFDNMVDYTNTKNKVSGLENKLIEVSGADNPYTSSMTEDECRIIVDAVSKLQNDITALEAHRKLMPTPIRTEAELYTSQTRRDELKKQLVSKINETNPHEDVVDRLTKVFETIDRPRVAEIDELKVKLEHQQFLLKLLTKKDSFIRQALLDINLPLLNSRMRHYLDIIGLPHKVEFTKDMSISISQFNNEIGYNNLSGGQQARINLAIAFSFRDVVQARHQKINVCVLDECLDTGLSNLGVKVSAKMIKQVAVENGLSMYVITHRDEIKSSFDRTLKAILKGGLTTVEFNPPLLPVQRPVDHSDLPH